MTAQRQVTLHCDAHNCIQTFVGTEKPESVWNTRNEAYRVGKKREDGTYEMKETLEWVPAHQRGLETGPYVPKTYNVAQGRKIPKLTEINTVEQESIVE